MSTFKVFPSAHLEPITNVEERLAKIINDMKSFNNSLQKIEGMITNFKTEYKKTKSYILKNKKRYPQ